MIDGVCGGSRLKFTFRKRKSFLGWLIVKKAQDLCSGTICLSVAFVGRLFGRSLA